jgi:hypothetical protein
VANALKTSEYDRSEITVHAYACQGKEVMRVRQKVEMHQVNRERNSMAHLLAQLGRTVHTTVCIAHLAEPNCNLSSYNQYKRYVCV